MYGPSVILPTYLLGSVVCGCVLAPLGPLLAHCPSAALAPALTQVCAMVLELLGELLQVGLSERNDLPATGLLQHSSVPVIGTNGSQQNPVLATGRGHTSALISPGAPLWAATPGPAP